MVHSTPHRTNHSSSSQPPPPSTTLQTAPLAVINAHIHDVEAQVKALRAEIVAVTDALSLRTARGTRVSVAHAATTEALSREAVSALARLRDTTVQFVRDVQTLRAQFELLATLAAQTADVRAALTTLETQVTKLVAARRANDAARGAL